MSYAATLYVQGDGPQNWTEIGIGEVFVRDDEEVPNQRNLCVYAADADRMLLRTPLAPPEAFTIENDRILVWRDDALDRVMALSFAERCECVEMARNVGASCCDDSQLHVNEGNIAGFARLVDVPFLFGRQVRDNETFVREVCALSSSDDMTVAEHARRIVLSLISPPLCEEERILRQLLDQECIDDVLRIIGTAVSGIDGQLDVRTLVNPDFRRGAFRNPGRMPPSTQAMVHYLHSIEALRDALPVSLTDGEAGDTAPVNLHILSLKLHVIHELFQDSAFSTAIFAADDVESMRHSLGFLHELTNVARGIFFAESTTQVAFERLLTSGLVPFLARCFASGADASGDVVSKAAEVFEHVASHVPVILRRLLLVDAAEVESGKRPGPCMLEALVVALCNSAEQFTSDYLHDAVKVCFTDVKLFNEGAAGDDPDVPILRERHLSWFLFGTAKDVTRPSQNVSDISNCGFLDVADVVVRAIESSANIVGGQPSRESSGAASQLSGRTSSVRMSASMKSEVAPHACVRVMSAILSEGFVANHALLPVLLERSRFLSALAMTGVAALSQKLRAACVSCCRSLVATHQEPIMAKMVEVGLIPSLVNSLRQFPPSRDNLWTSAVKSLMMLIPSSVRDRRSKGARCTLVMVEELRQHEEILRRYGLGPVLNGLADLAMDTEPGPPTAGKRMSSPESPHDDSPKDEEAALPKKRGRRGDVGRPF